MDFSGFTGNEGSIASTPASLLDLSILQALLCETMPHRLCSSLLFHTIICFYFVEILYAENVGALRLRLYVMNLNLQHLS